VTVRFPFAAAALAAILALTACTSPSEDVSASTSSPNPADELSAGSTGELAFHDEAGTADGGAVDNGDVGADSDDEDLVVFIAAGERMLADGPYEGVIHESPEIYVAVAQSFCDRLDEGLGVNRIVNDFAVEGGFDLTDSGDRILIGSVLGAGVETLCPRHRHLL
jgi:hypothetical protein